MKKTLLKKGSPMLKKNFEICISILFLSTTIVNAVPLQAPIIAPIMESLTMIFGGTLILYVLVRTFKIITNLIDTSAGITFTCTEKSRKTPWGTEKYIDCKNDKPKKWKVSI